MRILFGSWPAYGHLLPMVPLIRAAQRAGHQVVVSSGADLATVVSGLGVEFHPSGVTLAESYARLPDATTISALPPHEQAAFAAQHLFGAGAVDRARDVVGLIGDWRPDLVVHDILELGTPTAATGYGVPHVTHGYGPMVPGTRFFADAIGGAIAGAGLTDPIPAVLAGPYLDICPPAVTGTEESPWTDTRPLRPSAGEVPPGAALPAAFASLPHPETVYLTLGTITNQAPEVFRAAVGGCARLPVNVVVTTGPGLDPAVLGPLPPHVLAVPFLPQALLLPHCRAVVSHAGAGTMLGALVYGLPQLCLPQGTDQPFNTAALLPSGAALALQPDETTAEAVAAALTRLLGEPSFPSAAQSVRAEIAAMPDADTVLAGLLASVSS